MRDPEVGILLNERGLRGLIYYGAKSVNQPDVEVIYEDQTLWSLCMTLFSARPELGKWVMPKSGSKPIRPSDAPRELDKIVQTILRAPPPDHKNKSSKGGNKDKTASAK